VATGGKGTGTQHTHPIFVPFIRPLGLCGSPAVRGWLGLGKLRSLLGGKLVCSNALELFGSAQIPSVPGRRKKGRNAGQKQQKKSKKPGGKKSCPTLL